MKLKETQLFLLVIKLTKSFAVPKAFTRRKLREALVSPLFRTDNYAVVTEIFVNKYCTKAC